MSVRTASEKDHDLLHSLWQQFKSEEDTPGWWHEDWAEAWMEIRNAMVGGGAVFIATVREADIGFAVTVQRRRGVAYLNDLYVVPRARRQGVAKTLLHAVVTSARARGDEVLMLNVDRSNISERRVYDRLMFREQSVHRIADVDALEHRLLA